ncbi:unnamed protein product, partial [Choristocarpus tenellus]
KGENLLEHCSCLFRKSAEVKSSEGMLKVFCQFLHGEGDFVRHLRKMGYTVHHVQAYIDEFDYRVTNLAMDLRDGVRLARLVEVVTGLYGITRELRLPAMSRLQASSSLSPTLFVLRGSTSTVARDNLAESTSSSPSWPPSVTAKDIVDGQQEATLRLLWSIITRYSLSTLVSKEALVREVKAVLAARAWRASSAAGNCGSPPAVHGPPGLVLQGALRGRFAPAPRLSCGGNGVSGDEVEATPPAVGGTEHPPLPMPDVSELEGAVGVGSRKAFCVDEKKEGVSGVRSDEDECGRVGDNDGVLAALMAWCRAVCHGYGVPVRNFTSSFADGRALCLLLHYYHPQVG